jgi:hypothetical protein
MDDKPGSPAPSDSELGALEQSERLVSLLFERSPMGDDASKGEAGSESDGSGESGPAFAPDMARTDEPPDDVAIDALERRFDDLAKDWSETTAEIGEGEVRRTVAVRRILQRAQLLAVSLNHGEMLREHLLVAMTFEGEAIARLRAGAEDEKKLRENNLRRLADEKSLSASQLAGELVLSRQVRGLLGRAGANAARREPELRVVSVSDLCDALLLPERPAAEEESESPAKPTNEPKSPAVDPAQTPDPRLERFETNLMRMRMDADVMRRTQTSLEEHAQRLQSSLEQQAEGVRSALDRLTGKVDSLRPAEPLPRRGFLAGWFGR